MLPNAMTLQQIKQPFYRRKPGNQSCIESQMHKSLWKSRPNFPWDPNPNLARPQLSLVPIVTQELPMVRHYQTYR